MTAEPRHESRHPSSSPTWVDAWVARSTEIPYVAPFMAFLLLMWVGGQFDRTYLPWAYALRTFGALAVAIVFWKYLPPLGRPHVLWAIPLGLLVAFGWVYLHKAFAAQPWYAATQLLGHDAPKGDFYDPYARLGAGFTFWLFLIVRIGGASVVVPIVEELFWRGFLLRALIRWNDFALVPLGAFTLRSFLFCSLLSAAEHPMWEVGILCWVVYNLLFYWKKSLLFLIVVHGITNLALYSYVVVRQDWVFWS